MKIKNLSKISIAVTSAMILNGCLLNDPYDYDKGGDGSVTPPPAVSAKHVVYGAANGSVYQHVTENSSGDTVTIDPEGNTVNGNITVEGLEPEKVEGTLLVKVSDEQSFLYSEQAGGNPVSVDINPSVDVLALNLEVTTPNTTYAQVETEVNGTRNIAEVDISRALVASQSAGEQQLLIPTHCFADADFNAITKPSSLNVNGTSEFKLHTINYSTPENDIYNLPCEVTSLEVVGNAAGDFMIADLMLAENGEIIGGLTPNIGAWLTDGSVLINEIIGNHVMIDYTNATTGANGGLVFEGDQFLDISNFVANGWLEFMMHVESYGNHPTRRFQLQMEGSAGNSQPYFFEEGFAEGSWQQVRVPVSDLFTDQNGQLNFNQIFNMNKSISMFPEWISEENSLQGIVFRIAGAKLVSTN